MKPTFQRRRFRPGPWRAIRWALAGVACAAASGWRAEAAADELETNAYRARVVLFVAEGLTLPDLLAEPDPDLNNPRYGATGPLARELRGFRALARRGGVGLMSPTTVGTLSPQSACLTLGAGRRGQAGAALSEAHDVETEVKGVSAGDRFHQLTGRPAPEGGVVNLGQAAASRQRHNWRSLALPGALGDWLGRGGFRTAVYGNADRGDALRRHATALVMDRFGAVSAGSVELSLSDVDWATDLSAMVQFVQLVSTCHVLVVDLGGPGLEKPGWERSKAAVTARFRAVRKVDRALFELLRRLNPDKTSVFLVAPTPADLGATRLRLTPCFLTSPGSGPGILFSPSTRSAGLLSNVDVAPTVIALLGGKPAAGMTGRPVEVLPAPPVPVWNRLLQADRSTERQAAGLYVLLRTGVALVLTALALGALVLLLGERLPRLWPERARVLLLAAMGLPLPVLLLAPLYPARADLLTVCLLGGALLTGIFSYLAGGRRLGALCTVCGLTLWAIATDTLSGGFLVRQSFLGRWPVWGGFYGLGNACVGVSLACLLLLTGGVLSLRPNWHNRLGWWIAVGGAFTGWTLLVALPNLGANFGGGLTCAAATTFGLVSLVRPHWSAARRLLTSAAAGVTIATLVIALDTVTSPEQQAHFAGVWTTLHTHGPLGLVAIWQQKFAHNLWLMSFSPTTYGLLVIFVVFACCLYYPPTALAGAWERYPAFRAMFGALPVAAVVAYLFNDSGLNMVTALATVSIPALVYVLLQCHSAHLGSPPAASETQ